MGNNLVLQNENKNTIASRKWTKKYKHLAFKKISNDIKCCRCGLKNESILQINHKDGDGNKEHQSIRSFYRRVAIGERKVEDLEIVCSLCNWAYFLERKYNVNYKINLINGQNDNKKERIQFACRRNKGNNN